MIPFMCVAAHSRIVATLSYVCSVSLCIVEAKPKFPTRVPLKFYLELKQPVHVTQHRNTAK